MQLTEKMVKEIILIKDLKRQMMNDLILISDVDEIPNLSEINLIKLIKKYFI